MNCYYLYAEDSTEIDRRWQADRIVVEKNAKHRTSLKTLVDALQSGDTLIVRSFSAVSDNSAAFLDLMSVLIKKNVEFVSLNEQVDTASETGRYLLSVCRELIALNREDLRSRQREGVERAREEGKYKGRKPITVDDALFSRTLERWQNGEITARQAMQEHNLKPNTFYRRVKERAERDCETIKSAAKGIREEIKTGVL